MLQRNSDLPYVVPDEPVSRPAENWQYPTVDLREMGRILRRRYRLLALPAVVLVALALAYLSFATTLYTATSTVLVDPRRANVVEANQSVLSNFGTDDATIESQTLLIQSVSILASVVNKLQLTSDPEFKPKPGLLDPVRRLFSTGGPSNGASPEDAAKSRSVEILQKRMKVTRQGTTFLVDVAVNSEAPQKAATIANAIADAYFEEQVRTKYDATRIAANWLNGQIDDLKSRVGASEKAVEEFRSANNLMVSQGVTLNDQQITDLNNKLIAARVQTAEARAKYQQVQDIAKSGGDPGGINAAISSEMITKLRTQYADIAKNEADLSIQVWRASSPGRQCPGPAARYPETHQRGNPASSGQHEARLRGGAFPRDVAATESRPASGRVHVLRPGPGAAARTSARGRGQPYAL